MSKTPDPTQPTGPAQTTLTGRERQFLVEAANPFGRVAGHNNLLAQKMMDAGLVASEWRGIKGQSNYHITDTGKAALS